MINKKAKCLFFNSVLENESTNKAGPVAYTASTKHIVCCDTLNKSKLKKQKNTSLSSSRKNTARERNNECSNHSINYFIYSSFLSSDLTIIYSPSANMPQLSAIYHSLNLNVDAPYGVGHMLIQTIYHNQQTLTHVGQ